MDMTKTSFSSIFLVTSPIPSNTWLVIWKKSDSDVTSAFLWWLPPPVCFWSKSSELFRGRWRHHYHSFFSHSLLTGNNWSEKVCNQIKGDMFTGGLCVASVSTTNVIPFCSIVSVWRKLSNQMKPKVSAWLDTARGKTTDRCHRFTSTLNWRTELENEFHFDEWKQSSF